MNAKKISKVSVGLTLTALALCGALVVSASCAGDGGGTGGTAGSAGGSSGGSGGGAGGAGGGGATCTAGTDETCFATGKASGVLNGYGYIALGELDTASSPVCDNTANGGTASEAITKAKPCPEVGGTTKWSSDSALCISGDIPMVVGANYTANWGIQIGMNVTDPAGGSLDKSYSKITYTWTGGTTPTNTAIRGIIHRKQDNIEAAYCATLQSGTPVTLTAFNTMCWDGTGVSLTADDVPNIDKIGIQISSDDKSAYKVTDFCLTKVAFTP